MRKLKCLGCKALSPNRKAIWFACMPQQFAHKEKCLAHKTKSLARIPKNLAYDLKLLTSPALKITDMAHCTIFKAKDQGRKSQS